MDSGLATVTVTGPMPDGSGWRFAIFAESGNDVPAAGTDLRRLREGLVT